MKKLLLISIAIASIFTANAQWQTIYSTNCYDFYISKNKELYVVTRQDIYSDRSQIMKFDGTEWVKLGEEVRSRSGVRLYFNSKDEIYAATNRLSNNTRFSQLMKFDGTEWVELGEEVEGFFGVNFGGSPAHLYFNSKDELYAATFLSNSKTQLMKFDGTEWIKLGEEVGRGGVRLYFNSKDELYAAANQSRSYREYFSQLMKFDGTEWVELGEEVEGKIDGIYFNSEDEIYVNKQGGHEVSTYSQPMKFDGTEWVELGGTMDGYAYLYFNSKDELYIINQSVLFSFFQLIKFDGTELIKLGEEVEGYFEGNDMYYNREDGLYFNSEDELYVFCYESYNRDSVKLMKFNETAVSITEVNQNHFAKVYPNPANSILNIDISSAQGTSSGLNVSIVNILGATVATQKLTEGNNSIDVSNLTKGIYFLQTENGGMVKFVKE